MESLFRLLRLRAEPPLTQPLHSRPAITTVRTQWVRSLFSSSDRLEDWPENNPANRDKALSGWKDEGIDKRLSFTKFKVDQEEV